MRCWTRSSPGFDSRSNLATSDCFTSGPKGSTGDSPPSSYSAAPDLRIVVPVYNEAENFTSFCESLSKSVRTPFELLVVYDHDDDSTLPVARRLAETDRRIRLVKNERPGVLGALKTGLQFSGAGAVIVTMADGSDDHARIDEMYQLYKRGYHLVAASRYMKGG